MSTASSTLLERLDESIPRVPLGEWPTPVQIFDVDEKRPGAGDLWIKRDDLSSPICGGNKVRKLEYLLAGPPSPVLTFGGSGSHHVLATAIHARRLGRSCRAVVSSQPATPHSVSVAALNVEACEGIIEMDGSIGALTRLFSVAAGHVVEGLSSRWRIIPPGGSNPLGTLGYVRAGLELAGQIESGECPKPRRIYVALGSGGTAAGLSLGLSLARLDCEVIAVRVATRLAGNGPYLRLLAARTGALLERISPVGPVAEQKLEIVHGFIGDGYGHPTVSGDRARERAAASGISLEPTYTAKALAAMFHDLDRGVRGPLMFLDTYGPMEDVNLPGDRRAGRLS